MSEELTAAHWDACSLDCPVMTTGGKCGQDLGVRCPGWSSKFHSAAAELVYSWTLDSGQDDECGNAVDWHWWAAIFRSERLIIETMTNGSVYLQRFDSDAELNAAWSNREEAYAGYVHSECKDGRECEGCVSCDNA